MNFDRMQYSFDEHREPRPGDYVLDPFFGMNKLRMITSAGARHVATFDDARDAKSVLELLRKVIAEDV